MGDGRIPGPLGIAEASDRAEGAARKPRLAGPIGLPDAGMSSGVDAFNEFKAAVLQRQIRNARAKGRPYCANVPDGELAVIEGKHRMRIEAAEQCRALLAAAREALTGAKSSGDSEAAKTKRIGVHSAYRNIEEDTLSWNASFKKYYATTRSQREALPGGVHGKRALSVMLRRMISYKAAPGYSNHSNGLAVDFSTTHGGETLKSNTTQRNLWKNAWLYSWLVGNAGTYGFQPLASEEWHWDYA